MRLGESKYVANKVRNSREKSVEMKFYKAKIQKIKGKLLFLLVSAKTFHIIGVVKHLQDKHLFQREENFQKSYNFNVIS